MTRSLMPVVLRIAAASLLLTGVAMLLLVRSMGGMWAGEWAWTVDSANGLPLAGGPFLAGLTASIVHRFRELGVHALARQTVRDEWLLRVLLGSAVLGSLVAWGMITSALLVMTAVRSAIGPRHLGWLVLGLAVQLGYAAVGAVFGRAVQRPWVAPAAFVTTFALSYVAANGSVPPIYRVGGSTGTLAGQVVSPSFMVWACLTHLALVTAAVLALGVDRGRARQGFRRCALVVVAAMLVAVALPGVLGSPERLQQAGSVTLVCAGRHAQTCMTDDTASTLPRVAALVDRYVAELYSLGATTPARFVQSVPGQRASQGDGLMSFGAQVVNSGANLEASAASLVSTPAACPQYFAPEAPEAALRAQLLLESYLRYRVDPSAFPPGDPDLQRWFDTGAATWTTTTYEALRLCDLADIDLPAL